MNNHAKNRKFVCSMASPLAGCLLIVGAMLGWPRAARAIALPNPMTMEALINGQLVEGSPLAWTGSKVYLLTRNGGVAEFSPGSAKDYKKISDNFVPYPPNMLRGMLQAEFGPQFEVTGT